MSFGRRQQAEAGAAEAGPGLGVRAGRVANVLLVVALALPIVTAAAIFGSINFHLWRALPPFDPLLARIESAQKTRGVVSGDDPAALERLYRRLERMAASAAEARRARALHIVFHSLGAHGAQTEPRGQRIALDLANIGAAAAVLIADRPTAWQVGGAHGARAKLGFEGPFAFDLADAPDGLVAGFRIGAFGAGETASPRDYAGFDSDKARRRRTCRALERWRRYFDVTRENLFIWAVTGAHRIAVGERTITADARVAPDVNGVAGVCGLGAQR